MISRVTRSAGANLHTNWKPCHRSRTTANMHLSQNQPGKFPPSPFLQDLEKTSHLLLSKEEEKERKTRFSIGNVETGCSPVARQYSRTIVKERERRGEEWNGLGGMGRRRPCINKTLRFLRTMYRCSVYIIFFDVDMWIGQICYSDSVYKSGEVLLRSVWGRATFLRNSKRCWTGDLPPLRLSRVACRSNRSTGLDPPSLWLAAGKTQLSTAFDSFPPSSSLVDELGGLFRVWRNLDWTSYTQNYTSITYRLTR